MSVTNDRGRHLTGDDAELGLGVLTGRERAQAIEHLQWCDQCRSRVDAMAFTSDELLRLLPGQQPPAGFSAQVTQRLRRAAQTSVKSRRSRRLAVAAAVVAVAAAGLAGWGMRSPGSTATPVLTGPAGRAAPAALRMAALFTPAHRSIGHVYLHAGSQTWMFTTIDLEIRDTTIVCQLIDRTGHVITVGSFWLANGDGYWGSPEPDQPAVITRARLITTAGVVLATASFGPAGKVAG
jgi:hypothetical protein